MTSFLRSMSGTIETFVQCPQAFEKQKLLPLRSDVFWQIESGFVRSLTWNSEGDVITLGIWGKGDIVGRTLSRLEVYQLECLTPVEAIALAYPEQCSFEALQCYLQNVEALLSIAHIKRIRDRLLTLLHLFACRFGEKIEQGYLLQIRLTHQVIAELIGTTRVTVTRLFNELEDQGMISRPGRHRTVLHFTRS
ncbi:MULTISPECIES: Crp/Fnr family transcriptional regulator [Leptolyngbya]|uniref:Crp/Fnr family transcriptional regulator n=1 Tax=Leptolyngbya TaxID=47251 RepID=UPI001F55407C|nr:Crp/Fnr family transcriptional regulator [Leptolyngbya sp. FACHB-1624]